MSQLKTTSLSHKDNNTGTPNITMYPDGTTSLNYAATGFKNLIINGSLIIDQRAGGFVNSGNFGADRWLVYAADTQMSRSRITDLPGFAWALSVRNTQGGTTGKGVRQCIELIDSTNTTVAPFVKGAVYTHSFWCRQRTGAAVDASAFGPSSVNFVDGVQSTTNSSAACTATPFVQIESNGNWRRFSRQITIDQDANVGNTCLRVNITAFEGTEMSSSSGVYYTGVQLEPGPTASDFEFRFIGTELALCQRYFQPVTNAPSNTAFAFGTQTSGGNWRGTYTTAVTMRTLPRVLNGTGLSITGGANSQGDATMTVQAQAGTNLTVQASYASGLGNNNSVYALRQNVDQNLALDAEL